MAVEMVERFAHDYQAVQRLRDNLNRLLKILGKKGTCKGCGAEIWWLKTKAGKWMPINEDGEVHWATCPKAKQFKGKDT